MKLFTAIFFTASFISLRALVAQEAGTVPVPENTPAPSAPSFQPAPPPLFPGDNPPPIVNRPPHSGSGGDTDRGAAAGNPPVKTGKTVENIADNVVYRKAKTQALRDDKVQQALADVNAAKNDPDKRAALKRYYTLLSGKVLNNIPSKDMSASIKKLVAARLKQSLLELDESKVRPGEYPQQASAGH